MESRAPHLNSTYQETSNWPTNSQSSLQYSQQRTLHQSSSQNIKNNGPQSQHQPLKRPQFEENRERVQSKLQEIQRRNNTGEGSKSYKEAMNAMIHPPQTQYRRKVYYKEQQVEKALKEATLEEEGELKGESEQTEKDQKEISQLKAEVIELYNLNKFLEESHKKEIEEKDLEILKKNEEIKLLQAEIQLMQDELKKLKSGEQEKHYHKQKSQQVQNHDHGKSGAASVAKDRPTKHEERKYSKLIVEYNRKRKEKHQQQNQQMNELQMLQMALDAEDEKLDNFENLGNFDHEFYQCGLSERELLRAAIEESKRGAQPNPDNMSYEQLLALGDQIGKVSKGLSFSEIAKIPTTFWNQNSSSSKECAICYEEFTSSSRIKSLPYCNHEYHQSCIDKWLTDEKRCPVCNMGVAVGKTQR